MSDERIFVVYAGQDGCWEVDGAHGSDHDLTPTLGILKRLGVPLPILKITIKNDPRVGGAWPTVEDLTLDFEAAEPAAAWSANDSADAESERAFAYERSEDLLP